MYRSANVGMSNQTAPENGARRNTKVSWATEVVPGLVDPKANPKGVVDGKQVNIPAPKLCSPEFILRKRILVPSLRAEAQARGSFIGYSGGDGVRE